MEKNFCCYSTFTQWEKRIGLHGEKACAVRRQRGQRLLCHEDFSCSDVWHWHRLLLEPLGETLYPGGDTYLRAVPEPVL